MSGATHNYTGERQYGLVTINGIRYRLAEPPVYNNLASLAGKVTFGDYTRDSDENTSSKIWTEFTGGIGIEHIREGSDEGTYWYGNLDAKTPFQLALGRETLSDDSVVYPLGDFDDTFYATDGTTFFTWDEATLAYTDTTDTVGATPVGPGVEYDGEFWVPCGASGVAQYDGTTNASLNASVQAIDLLDFDGDLYAITTDRQLYKYDGTSWTSLATFRWADTPRKLIVYMNRLEDDILYVVTNKGLLAWDKTNTTFIRTRFQVPVHYDNGRGAATWRTGEDLYYASGMQVYQYNVGGTQPMGPGGKEGVPARIRGSIQSFAPSFNSLFALIKGEEEVTAVVDDAVLDEGMYYDDALYGSPTAAVGTVMEFTGSGWHPCWESSGATGQPNWIVASSTSDHERVFWGYGTTVYTQKLSKASALPRQRWEAGEARFAASGSLDTGWFDGNMFGYQKTASHLEINVANVSTTAWIAVDYATDNEDGFPHTLSSSITAADDGTSRGKIVLPFGVETIDVDGVSGPFSRGLAFNRIRFRIRMETGDPEESPIIDSLVLKFVKQAQPYALYSLTIDLDVDAESMGRTPSEIKKDLNDLIVADEFAWVRLGNFHKPVFRALITAERGSDATGLDQRSTRQISVIEYPLDGYEGLPGGYSYEP
jgi:hypothetical protein